MLYFLKLQSKKEKGEVVLEVSITSAITYWLIINYVDIINSTFEIFFIVSEHKMLLKPSKLYDPFWHTYNYYKNNLKRFTKLVRTGEFEKIFHPGRFSTEPQNNIEQILEFQDKHFGNMINATLSR